MQQSHFRVKGSNHDGIWNEEGRTLRIIITPPWWKTWWAYLLYVLTGVTILYLWFQWRFRTIRRHNKELAQKVEERTHELKETQAQLIQTSKMASLGEMVAGLAHEINNPVTFIICNFEFIRSDLHEIIEKNSDEELKASLSEIDKELVSSYSGARRISEIVQNLKNFSKLDESECKGIRIHNEIDTILDLFFNQLRDIQFIRQYDSSLNEQLINCYASQINQCIRNIIINSVQAIREAEKKNILTAGTGQVTIASAKSEHQVQLSFKDNGIGIPEDILDKVFDPFFTTRDVGFGKGLGLAEAYGIIQKHKGTITINSEYGKGTEVRIVMPYYTT